MLGSGATDAFLRSTGYDAEEDLAGAVQAFQTKEAMETTGTMDDALRAKLKERFGE
jgi:hypothetical protein